MATRKPRAGAGTAAKTPAKTTAKTTARRAARASAGRDPVVGDPAATTAPAVRRRRRSAGAAAAPSEPQAPSAAPAARSPEPAPSPAAEAADLPVDPPPAAAAAAATAAVVAAATPSSLRFRGRRLAPPSLASLLHSASRGVQPTRDDDFLPTGYLQVTQAHDLGAGVRGRSDSVDTTLAGSGDEVLVLELADGGTLITSAQRLKDALARNRPDLIGAEGAVLFDRLSTGDEAARGVPADLAGGLVSKVFTLLVGASGSSDPIIDLARDKLAEWTGAKAEGAVVDVAAVGASWLGAKALMWAIESRLERPAGRLYRWQGEGELTGGSEDTGPPADEARPMLVFLHGTGSSTLGSFGGLRRGDIALWSVLEKAFPGGIYGFEHRTLSESPIDNALQLLKALPKRAKLSLVSHSRGGLIADLLCLANLESCIDAYHYEFKEAAIAPQLADAHAEQRARLAELAVLLNERRPEVQRYLRVASPAQGTKLASANFDVFLSGLLTLIGAVPYFFGNPLYAAFKRVVIEVARRRTDAHLVPGIECMLPDSPMAALLARAEVRPGLQMGLIAGDIEGGNLLVRLGVLLTDFVLFDQVDNDLVVDTAAMLGGVAAKAGARVLFDRGAKVSHFNYFSNPDTRGALRDWLSAERPADNPAFQALPGHFDSLDALGIAARGLPDADRPVVVLLPGIMGSHLAVPRSGRIWLDPLRIAFGGLDELAWNRNPVEAEAVFDLAYGALIRHLSSSHRVLTFPYDWRLPLDVLGDRLGEMLARLQKDTAQPIRLLAHSMGGLVVRACIHRRRPVMDTLMAREGARLVMLGTPNQGAHSMVENLLGKGGSLRTLVRLDLKHDMQQVLDLVAGFPGALQLLPRPGFNDTFQGSPDGGEPAAARPFFEAGTWPPLKTLNTDLWFGDHRGAAPGQATLDSARWLWRQDERAAGAAGTQAIPALPADYAGKAVYVFGVAANTACGTRVERGRLRMVGTSRGDGTVTWDSGRIGGIGRFYYLPAAHGDLLSTRPCFAALTDLLVSGATSGLSATPPALRAIEQPAPRVYDPGPPELADSGQAEMALLGGTPSRQVVARAQRRLDVRVRAMDLRFLTQPILVGHYEHDPIAGPQRLIDSELLDGQLSQRHALGLYAGPLGSAVAVLRAPNPAERDRGSLSGAVVAGLGNYDGTLSQDKLTLAVRASVLRYLLQAVDVLGPAERELPLATLLLGYNSAASLSISASLEAIVRGVLEANNRFKDTTGLNLRVARLDIVELYLDTAISAVYELRQLAPRLSPLATRLDTQLVCGAELVQGEGLRQRLFDGGNGNYWPRLIVTDAGGPGGEDGAAATARRPAVAGAAPDGGGVRLADRLRFLYVGQRARAESLVQQRQPALIETLVGQQITSAVWNEDFGRLLFQLLVPPDFKESVRQLDRVVLVVDAATANLPWELMLADPPAPDDGSAGITERVPLAVRTPVIRQLATGNFRRQVQHSASRNALVVGNPAVSGFASHFPDERNPKGLEPDALPGAETEATEVARLLANMGYQVGRAIGSDTSAAMVLAKLYRQAYRVLHVSAHGVFEQLHVDGLRRSGVVLSGGLLITAAEIAAMESVPELVFLNCCHLGQVQATDHPTEHATVRQGNKLAASVARELIDIGVRCVVVAGWAVTDSLALQFGQVFYQALMQQRRTFGDAVHLARQALWAANPADITWGAFQAYGDPGWLAEPGSAGSAGASEDQAFVSMDELLDQLARIRAEFSRRPERQSESARRERVGRIQTLLDTRCPPAWRNSPGLLSALGATWRDLGEPALACDALLAALQADDAQGQVPIRDLEQLANLEARLGERQARAAIGQPNGGAGQGGPAPGVAAIDRAIDRLQMLDRIVAGAAAATGSMVAAATPNAERAALLGSAFKRKASVFALQVLALGAAPEHAAQRRMLRLQMETALRQAGEAYRQGEGLPGGPQFKPYNVLNRLALEALLSAPDDDASQRDARALATQCRQALGSAFGVDGDVWLAVMQPETVLVEQLRGGGLAADGEAASSAWQAVSQAYAEAVVGLLIKPWQLDSVVAQLELLAIFSDAMALAGDDLAAASGWQRQSGQLDRLVRQLQPTRPARTGRPS